MTQEEMDKAVPKLKCNVCQQPILEKQKVKNEGLDYYHEACWDKRMDVKRRRKMIKTELWPFLEMSCKSIEDVKVFCQSVSIAVNQAFENKKRKSALNSLDLVKMLDHDNEDYKKFKFILDLLKDESIFDSLDILDGMTQVVEGFIREEMSTRPPSSLKTDFID